MNPLEGLEMREVKEQDLRAMDLLVRRCLLLPPTSEKEVETTVWRISRSPENMEAFGMFDQGQAVGQVGSYNFDMMIPGDTWIPCSGITRVGVESTHRRRGILKTLMKALLEKRRARGDVAAILRASEPGIYPNFGFGAGSEVVDVEVDIVMENKRPLGKIRLLKAEEALDVVMGILKRVPKRVGMLDRPDWMVMRSLEGLKEKGDQVFVHLDVNGKPDGYVLVNQISVDFSVFPLNGTMNIAELWGMNPEVERDLLYHVCNADLMKSLTFTARPMDDWIKFALSDVGKYQVKKKRDELWIRLLNVDEALTRRSFGSMEELVIEVEDSWFADNCGKWKISKGKATKTNEVANLKFDMHCISTIYLGGISAYELWYAGKLQGKREDVLLCDRLFSVNPKPWCISFF